MRTVVILIAVTLLGSAPRPERFAEHRAFARALGGQPDLYDHAPYFTH